MFQKHLTKTFSLGRMNEIKHTITELCVFDLLPSASCLEYFDQGITVPDLLFSFQFYREEYSKLDALAERFNSKLNEEKKSLQPIKDDNMKVALVIGVLIIAAVGVGIFLRKRLSGEKVTHNPSPGNPWKNRKEDGFSRIALAVPNSELENKIKADELLNRHLLNGKILLTKEALEAMRYRGYFLPQNEELLKELTADCNISIIKPEEGALFDAAIMKTSDLFTGKVQVSSVISLGLKTTEGKIILHACVRTTPVTE